MAFKRYWYHPESDSVWFSSEDEKARPGAELVEEIDFGYYLELTKGKGNMTGINYSFDARQFEPVQGIGTSHPVGKFPATISHTENVETKAKDGGMFVVTFTTPAGSIQFRYNLWNKEPKAVEIAHKQLSALCHATGVFQLGFQDEGAALRNARCMIEVGYQKGEDPATNSDAKGYTEVKKVYDANGNEPGKAPQQAPQTQGGGWGPQQQPQQQQPNQQQPQGWANPNAAPQQQAAQQAPQQGWGPQQQNPNQAWQPGPTQQAAGPANTEQKPPWAR